MLYVLIVITCVLSSNALTPEEVLRCLDIVASRFVNDNQFNQTEGILNETTAAQLIESEPDLMTLLCEQADRIQDLSTPITTTGSTPSPDTCGLDGNNQSIFCNPSKVPLTPGEDYQDLRDDLDVTGVGITILANAAEHAYTDGNAVSELFLDLAIADSVGNIFSVVAETAAAFGPIAGALFGAIDAGSNAAREQVRAILDKADIHDGILMTQHLTALNEDRKRIISNQRYLERRMMELFKAQNEWLEIKFNDIFKQLNTIDKLVRTPTGRRPGWGDQTGLDDLFVEPTDVDVPSVDNTN